MNANKINVQFLGKVRKRNSAGYIFGKFFVGFFIIFVVATVLGVAFCKFSTNAVSDDIKRQISGHFTDVFASCESMADYFSVIILASSADIRYLVLIFAAGFTFFCKYATGAMIGVRAFSLGFCAAFLVSAIRENAVSLPSPSLSVAAFVAARLFVLALMIYLSVKSTVFGDDFRRLRGRRSLILRSPVIYRYIFLFLTAFGLVISVNAAYCFISSII